MLSSSGMQPVLEILAVAVSIVSLVGLLGCASYSYRARQERIRLRLHRFRLRMERLRYVKPDLTLNGKLKLPHFRWKRSSSKRQPRGDQYEDAMSPQPPVAATDPRDPSQPPERIYYELEKEEDCEVEIVIDGRDQEPQPKQKLPRQLSRPQPDPGYTEVDIVDEEPRMGKLHLQQPSEYNVLGSKTLPILNMEAGPVRAYDHVILSSPTSSSARTLPADARRFGPKDSLSPQPSGNEYDVSTVAVEANRVHVISDEYHKLGQVTVTSNPEPATDTE